MDTQDKEKSAPSRNGFLIVPFLILLGLFAAPPTRGLFQAQLQMLHDITPLLARLREMGVKEGPPSPAPRWEGSPTAASVARLPEDYEIQLGGAMLEASYTNGGRPTTPQEAFDSFQRQYGARLNAISAHFPNRPGPYAHFLRFMTMGAVRVSRDAEVEKFQTGKTLAGLTDRQVGYADSWAAFDKAAAQGEKLDPDNAYFPMMRALWLFDAKRDAEGISAILRAGQKSRFEDYTVEEPDAEWRLYLRSYGPSSVLVHQTIAAGALWPHYAALRAMGRLTAYEAEKMEQAGRTQDGLALRHAMTQCGVRMREQGHSIGVLVGVAIVSIQTNRPGGSPLVTPPTNLTDEQKSDRRRDLYLAYLHKIGAEKEAAWFAQQDAVGRQVRSLLESSGNDARMSSETHSLFSLWMLDMLLLINLSILLLLCTAAAVCVRIPGGEKVLPVVVFGLFACCLLAVLPMQWAEGLTQIRTVLNNMAMSTDEGGVKPDDFDISNLVDRFPAVVHVGEVLLSLLLPALTLLTVGVVSLMRRETFTTALARSLQRGVLVLATVLTFSYAGALIATAQAEIRADAALTGLTHNAVTYLQHRTVSDSKP